METPRNTRNVIWLFVAYFTTFIDLNLLSGCDLLTYVNRAESLHKLGVFIPDVFTYLSAEKDRVDFTNSLLTYFVAKYIGGAHELLFFYGLIYGYFYANCFVLMIQYQSSNSALNKFLLLNIFFIIPLQTVNGFRYGTALLMVLNFILKYLNENKKPFYLLVFAVLTHFSMSMFSIVVYFCYVFKKHIKIAKYILILSIFFSSMFEKQVYSITAELNFSSDSEYGKRLKSYANEDMKKDDLEFEATRNWYLSASSDIFYYTVVLLLILLPIKNILNEDKQWLGFVFLLMSVAILIRGIPGGQRFFLISYFLTFWYFMKYTYVLNYLNVYVKNVIFVLWTVRLIVEFRILFEFIGITTMFGNIFIKLISTNDYRIIDFAKIFIPSL